MRTQFLALGLAIAATALITACAPPGISESQAVANARPHVQAGATFRGATHGTIAQVYPRGESTSGVGPDAQVWAITFDITAVICPPSGDPCRPPQHAVNTVGRSS